MWSCVAAPSRHDYAWRSGIEKEAGARETRANSPPLEHVWARLHWSCRHWHAGPIGPLLHRDELAGWLAGMDRFSGAAGSDRRSKTQHGLHITICRLLPGAG
jgi:hypothetical protein